MPNKETFIIDLKDRFSKALGRAGKNLDAFRKKHEKELGAGAGKAAQGVGLGGLGGFASLGGIGLAAGAVVGLGAVVTDAVGTLRVFQKEMSKLGAFSKATTEELKLLKDESIRLGGATVFTATEVAQGMQEMAKTGLSTRKIISGMGDVLNFAAATNLELAEASDIATNVMTQFGLKATQMTRVVDTLSNTTVSNATKMGELAEAMKFLGPTANAMGVSIEETAATLGLLADGGLKGSIASRALGTALARLSKPTKEMQAKMKELGLTFFDSKGQFIGMINLVKKLESSMASMTPEQKQNTILTLFQADAMQEFNILLQKGSGELEKFTKANVDALGTTAQIAKKMADNWDGDLKRASSAWERFTLSVTAGNNSISKALRGTTQFFSKAVNSLSKELEAENLASQIGSEGLAFEKRGRKRSGGDDLGKKDLLGSVAILAKFTKEQTAINDAVLEGEDAINSLITTFQTELTKLDPESKFRNAKDLTELVAASTKVTELFKGGPQKVEQDIFLGKETQSLAKLAEKNIKSLQAELVKLKKGDAAEKGALGGVDVTQEKITDATTKIRGEKTKVFNINIGNLVEKLSFNKSSDSENELDMQRQITEILTRALNDAQTLAIGQG